MVSIKKKITALAVIAAIALIAYLFFAYRIITNPSVERKTVVMAIVLMIIYGVSYAAIIEMVEEKRTKRIMGILFLAINAILFYVFLKRYHGPRTEEILKNHLDWLSDLRMLSNIHLTTGMVLGFKSFIKNPVLEER